MAQLDAAERKEIPSRVLTFNGTAGSNVKLKAYNGLWYVVGTALGVTAS